MRVAQRELERFGRTNAADRGQCAAHHYIAGAKFRSGTRLKCDNQILRVQHRGDIAVLIHDPLAADGGVAGDLQGIPALMEIVVSPKLPRDRLVAHLF